MKSDCIVTVPKARLNEIKEKILRYEIVDRVATRTAKGKHGVTYPDLVDISVFCKPIYKFPNIEEFNNQFSAIQELQHI